MCRSKTKILVMSLSIESLAGGPRSHPLVSEVPTTLSSEIDLCLGRGLKFDHRHRERARRGFEVAIARVGVGLRSPPRAGGGLHVRPADQASPPGTLCRGPRRVRFART